MTELEFNITQLSLDDIGEIEKAYLIDVVSETCFFLPVRLTVNKKDLFQTKHFVTGKISNWIDLPAFNLIINWRARIDSLLKTGKEKIFLADAGEMIITYEGGLVRIMTNFNDIAVEENYEDFYDAVGLGIRNLTEELKRQIPMVFQNQEINQKLEWLTNKQDEGG
jgi:hypothetical protein